MAIVPAAPDRGIQPPARILPPMRRPSSRVAVFGLILSLSLMGSAAGVQAADRPVRIFSGDASTLDPAEQGDVTSASISAQLFETLTTFDADLRLQPALAQSWRVDEGGIRVVFHLRPDLRFSDGTPLRAADVVRSWLRLIDPADPSPLASLMLVVEGASAYMAGDGDASAVGLRADDAAGDVTVTLARPASDFPDVVSGPSFGIVPPGADKAGAFSPSDRFVGSGGYIATDESASELTLRANAVYWAGAPAIETIALVSDLGGRSAVEVFEDGDLDYAPISSFDATWIAYDRTLGPQLREVPSIAVEYYGFDTTRPPFDDVRIRRAFGMAVDWRRIAELGATDDGVTPATSMVPPGIPGRSERDFLPTHDPAAARALLADAGFPDGAGFPTVTMQTSGGSFDRAFVEEVRRELGIDLAYETMDFQTYFVRLEEAPPAICTLSWIADYPGRDDFLGVLLGSDSTNDYGGWTSPEFDAAIQEAAAAGDPAATSAAFDRAESIVQRDVPVVPVAYGNGWALSRSGLLGAGQNGLGIIRMAGLAWAD
jgi:ABC-type oligopeptide transport system substrate-binding subunit